jgi:hypothetical protein
MRYVLGTGVIAVAFQDEVNELRVTAGTGLQVLLDSGSAWIQGHYYKNDASKPITIAANTNPAGTRADLIVLECKWGTNAGITAKTIAGTPGLVWPAGSGSLTGLPKPATYPGVLVQQYLVKWQLPIAQVNVAYNASSITANDILDQRLFVNGGGVQSDTFVVASDGASPLIRANTKYVVPYGSIHAEDVINAAIADAYTYGGGTVKLSEGDFNISGSILPLSNVNLRGLGTRSRILAAQTSIYPAIYCNTQSNIKISDLYVYGNGVSLSPGACPAVVPYADLISIHDGSLVWVKDCHLFNARASGIYVDTTGTASASHGHRVEGCLIHDCASTGMQSSGNSMIISNNQFLGNGHGIVLAGANASWGASLTNVANNIVRENYYDGIRLVGPTGFNVTQAMVHGNSVINNGQNAHNVYSNIYLYGTFCAYNFITGNTIQSWMANKTAYGIYVDTTCYENSIMNNHAIAASIATSTNIKCGRAASSNTAPNNIRFNHSGSVAPNGSSYDA